MKMSGEKAIHRQELERGLLTQKISRLFLKYTIPGSSRPIIPRDSVGDRWCDIRAVCRGERFDQRESDLTLL